MTTAVIPEETVAVVVISFIASLTTAFNYLDKPKFSRIKKEKKESSQLANKVCPRGLT